MVHLFKKINIFLVILLFQAPMHCFANDAVVPIAQANKIYFKALKYYEHKNWEAAKEGFRDFLAVSDEGPLYIPAMYYLAYSLQQLNQSKKSATIYHKVITQVTEDQAFWGQMALKRLENGELTP